jgi:opacity protein-like surface antigen
MKKLSFSIAGIALLTSVMATAQPEQNLNRHTGPYVEGNLGTNLYSAGMASSKSNTITGGITGYSWNVAAGYNMNTWFGLEGGFTRSSIKVDYDQHDSHYQSINAPYATMRFTAPIDQRFSLIGKLGVMYANGSPEHPHDSAGGNAGIVIPYVGIGAGYAITPKVDITAQYQGALYGLVNGGALTGGVTYHF